MFFPHCSLYCNPSVNSPNILNLLIRHILLFTQVRDSINIKVLYILKLSLDLQFEQEVLDAHNYYRARHDAPALRLDDKLSKLATSWAQVERLLYLIECSV